LLLITKFIVPILLKKIIVLSLKNNGEYNSNYISTEQKYIIAFSKISMERISVNNRLF